MAFYRAIRLAHFKEFAFGFHKTPFNCGLRIPRERIFADDEMVKIVSQELSTSAATMPVVDAKVRAFRPVFVLSMFRFNNIKND
jgi:hypothetical protein